MRFVSLSSIFFPRFSTLRVQILFYLFGFAFTVLASVLFYTQVLKHDAFIQLSTKNRVRRVLVEAPRGKILDQKGVVLADNRPRFDLVLIREELPKNKKEYVSFLSQYLDIPQKTIWKTLQKSAYLPYRPAVLLSDVSLEKVTRVEERSSDLPALHVRVEPTRYYVLGESACHWLGTVGKIPQGEVETWQAKGIHMNEMIGRSGIERVMDHHLRGTVGGKQVQVNNRGYLDAVIGEIEPIPGNDLVLSMDSALQEKVSSLMEGKEGAAVVMDVKTGHILACVSLPGYDPNIFASGSDSQKIRQYFKNSKRPMFERAYKGTYSPGSLFKLIVALAYMQENSEEWKPRHVFCDGVFKLGNTRFRCWKRGGHGSLDLLDAIKYSCNVYFYTVGLELGPDKIAAMADRFGFGKKTGFLLGERRGLVPNPKWKKKTTSENWYGGDTANFSIGQGALLCTPIQMVSMFSAIASGGVWRSPSLLLQDSGEVRDLTDLASLIKPLKEGMRRVVQDKKGTGKRAFVLEMPGAGKTGTVEVSIGHGKKIKHAWFGGFAPYEEPEIAVVVLVEKGKSGGSTAAPIAGEIFSFYAQSKLKES